jgi:glucokinase
LGLSIHAIIFERSRNVKETAQLLRNSILGLDVGGTKTACVEGAPDGRILQRIEMPTQAHLPFAEVFPEIVSTLHGLIATANQASRNPIALSVSIGGPLRIDEGFLIDPPHLSGWHHTPLKAHLAHAFPSIPVFIEHDGNAGALAEFHFGVGKSRSHLKHLIFLTFGTGIGAGFIVNGQILRGASDTAGEIGHWRLADNGPLGFGKRGSWESFASGAGLIELAAQMFPSRWNSQTPISALVDAMIQDDREALQVAEAAGTWMGRGLALLIDALNPQVIVFGSLGVVLGERIFAPARKVINAEALPQAASVCELLPCALGKQIGDVAALMAALTDPSVQRVIDRDSFAIDPRETSHD